MKTMFNISSIYTKKENYYFDFDYYINNHMPRSIEILSKAQGFIKVSVEKGIDIKEQNIESSYIAMCHYYFDTLENFMIAFLPYSDELQNDIKNYTNIIPIIQINEVKLSK
ncbi:EthD family reductase [Sulfurimonas sp.]|uniref:EthD family reductase n=1 Tax=Sulfurimonas sp. TaxID=2022749 RepID=UPI003D116C05